MPLSATEIKDRILKALPDASIELIDLAGDNDHWAVTVIDPSFAQMPRVHQHQAVYKAIGDGMGTELHALKVTTKATN